VERFRQRLVEGEAHVLRQLVAAWAKANIEQLRNAWPRLPEALSDRQQDGAEPLLAIADLAGKDWPGRAREALVELFNGAKVQDDSNRTRLLSDIRTVFELNSSDRLATTGLLTALAEMETSPWAEFIQGRPLTPTTLARLLKPFDIAPRDIRIGSRILKGYERESFGDAWKRYLPPIACNLSPEAQQGQQAVIHAPSSEIGKGLQVLSVAAAENAKSARDTGVVADVAVLMSPSLEELDYTAHRSTICISNGDTHCRIHPANRTDWWSRGNDVVCGICHPGPI